MFGYGFGRRRAGFAGPGAAAVWRLASIRAGEAAFGASGTSNASVARTTSRVKDMLGSGHYQRLRYVDAGFHVSTANAEVALGNAVAIQRAVEIASPAQTVRVTWAGGPAGSVPDGAAAHASDDILPEAFGYAGGFAPGLVIWHRAMQDVAVGQFILQRPATGAGTPAGESSWRSANTSDQLMATGALAASGTARAATDAAPYLFVGLADDHGPTVGISGDSRFYGFGGDDGPGTAAAGGPIRMALEAAAVPHFVQARSATQLAQIVAGAAFANFAKRQDAFAYVGDVVSNYGSNDLNAGRGASQLAADVQSYVALVKGLGVGRVWWATIAPRTSTGNVPVAGFANTDANGRKAFNDALRAGWAAWGLAGVIDVSAAIEDPGQTDRWASLAYTTDGVHSSQAGQVLEAAPLQAWAAGLG